jgi:cell division protein FtsW (lipid II flippase)
VDSGGSLRGQDGASSVAIDASSVAGAQPRARVAWPSLIETVVAIAAIAAIFPWFARFGPDPAGHDSRFAAASPVVEQIRGSSAPRADALDAAKNAAMRELLPTAGWQWAAWMLAGLGLVKLARTRLSVAVGLSISLATWAFAAWAGRVPWPLSPDRALVLGRADARWDAMPAGFVVALIAIASVLLAISPWVAKPSSSVRQSLATRFGYPGFVAATGIGWLLLIDLSANGPQANRYLALYHHGHLWLAMLVLTSVAFARPALGRAFATALAVLDEVSERIGRMLGPLLAPAVLAALVIAIVGATGVLLTGVRQLTSELGRVWLIAGVAWFFFLRGAPVAEHLARSGSVVASLLRYAWPLMFVALVLVGTMLATRDLGPLLIASYAAGAFLAASVAMWWHLRSGAIHGPAALAVIAFMAWIAGVTYAVFQLGPIDEVTAGRLESLAAPLASVNDQLALVEWFRQSAPPGGFGLGAVPWCGFAGEASCAGVPAQIQSDYTFTALVGAFGVSAAWGITIGCAVWLHRLIRHHGRVTRGEPRFVRSMGRVISDHQALLSWIGVTWVVLTLCQLAVTVAGNLAVVPLTGVTFPFVSFGMTSLVVNSAFLALCLNVTLQEPADA